MLYYRIPGKEIVRKDGNWLSASFDEVSEGDFFISTFNKDQLYIFKEENGFKLTYLNDQPRELNAGEYKEALCSFKEEFDLRGIQKAIYSRVKNIDKPENFNEIDAFEKLCVAYPNAFVYLVSGEKIGTWMGATPETLISGEKGEFYTMALAGTKKEEGLSWTNKEIDEQAFVTDFILKNLTDSGIEDVKWNGPSDVYTGAVYHLKTDINFSTSIDKVKDVIKVLHPTPAVCGVPTDLAMELIEEIEEHSRVFYAGSIGLFDADGCQVFVNLRCMQIFENSLSIYVGGGITKNSIIEEEYQETVNKAQTLLKVIS